MLSRVTLASAGLSCLICPGAVKPGYASAYNAQMPDAKTFKLKLSYKSITFIALEFGYLVFVAFKRVNALYSSCNGD